MKISIRAISQHIFVILFLGLTNCILFTGRNFKRVEVWPPNLLIPSSQMSEINIHFSFFAKNNGVEMKKNEDSYIHEKRIGSLVSVYQECGIFKSVTATDTPKELNVLIELRSEADGSQLLAFLSGFSLGLIPSWTNGHATMKSTFTDKSGKILGAVEVSDTFHLWTHLILLPVMPFFWAPSVGENMNADMAKKSIEEAVQKGIIQ